MFHTARNRVAYVATALLLTLPALAQAQTKWYLAEGSTGFFEEEILIGNSSSTAANVKITYLLPSGSTQEQNLTVGATSRATVRVNDIANLASTAVSAVVESTNGVPIVVERTMYWGGASRLGGHNTNAVQQPAPDWFLAEGAANALFDEYILIENPGAAATTVVIDYYRTDGTTAQAIVPVAATSRRTVNPRADNGVTGAFSAHVYSQDAAGIIVERAMYWGGIFTGGTAPGGTNAAGVTATSTEWHFAEGFTASGFDTYVLIANPSASQTANVTTTFYLEDGTTTTKTVAIPPTTRTNIWVNYEVPGAANKPFSFSVRSTNGVGIVAERAMYWSNMRDGHAVTGVTAAATGWAFAEGLEGRFGANDYNTYFLIENPGDSPATVTGTFVREDGKGTSGSVTIAAHSRFTLAAATIVETSNQRFAAFFSSTQPVVAERTVYWGTGPSYTGGHASAGTPWTAAIALPAAPAAPTAQSVSPSSGTTAGGTAITIAGTNFTKGATVTVNGVNATVTSVTATAIVALTPAQPAGGANVTVTSNGAVLNMGSVFTYVAAGPPPPPPPPPCGALICDNLQGSTVGERIGGAFDSFGFVVTDPNAGIQYHMSPTLTRGYVEFEVTNVSRGVVGQKYEIVSMSDGAFSSGDLYRGTIEVREADKGVTRLKFLTGDGRDEKAGVSKQYVEADLVVRWNAGATYKVRLEWGPGQRVRVIITDLGSGAVVGAIDQAYGNAGAGGIYNPGNHLIRIGNPGGGDQASLPGIRVRNVRIGAL